MAEDIKKLGKSFDTALNKLRADNKELAEKSKKEAANKFSIELKQAKDSKLQSMKEVQTAKDASKAASQSYKELQASLDKMIDVTKEDKLIAERKLEEAKLASESADMQIKISENILTKASETLQIKEKGPVEENKSDKTKEFEKLDEQKAALEAMKVAIESQGKTASDMKEYQKAELAVQNKEFNLRKKNATSKSATKEIQKEQDAANAKQGSYLEKISMGISGLWQSGKDATKKAASKGLDILKGTALAALYLGIAMFLKSPYFQKAVDFLKNNVMPALMNFYENVLKPIGEVIGDVFGKQWDNVMALFDNIGESIQMFKDGDILGGINGIINSLGTFIIDSFDNLITGVYNIIAKMFGLKETDSVFGSISKWFGEMFDNVVNFFSEMGGKVKNFFTDIYDNTIKNIKESFETMFAFISELNMFKFIKETINNIVDKVKALFSPGGFSLENIFGLGKSLFDLVYAPINLAVNGIKDMFNLGDPDKPFKLSEFISETIQSVVKIFTDWFGSIKIPSIGEVISMAKDGFKKLGSFFLGGGNTKEEKVEKLYERQEKILEEMKGLSSTKRQEKMKEYEAVGKEIDAVQNSGDDNVAEKKDDSVKTTPLGNPIPKGKVLNKLTGETLNFSKKETYKGMHQDMADTLARDNSSASVVNNTKETVLTTKPRTAKFTTVKSKPTEKIIEMRKASGLDVGGKYDYDVIKKIPVEKSGGAPIIINAPTNTNAPTNNNSTNVTSSTFVEPDAMFRRNTQFAI